MKDIDFDELDKAVGSVLHNTDEPATDVSAQAPSNPAPTPPLSRADSSRAPIVAPARRRGQFLDMVHPSADMTQHPTLMPSTPRKALNPVALPVTEAPADAPSDAAVVRPPGEEVKDPLPEASPVTEENKEPEESTAPATAFNSNWPDPLDMVAPAAAPAAPEQKSEEVPVQVVVPDPLPAEEPEETEAVTPQAPQTPFVTDAQVEKRPLGAFQPTPEVIPEGEESKSDEQPVPHDDAERTPPPELLSPELDSSVVSVEAQEEVDKEPEITTEKVETSEVAPVLASATAPVVQSISQQYPMAATTPSSDETPHALFGDEYHQPLLAEGHKKGFPKLGIIVIFVVILLVIGAVLGYLAYTSGL